MARLVRIGEIYGYIVCLVALMMFLFSIEPLIGALFDITDPPPSAYSSNLSSFAKYKMSILRSAARAAESQTSVYIPDDESIREMMEAERMNETVNRRLWARRKLTDSSVTVLICIALFVSHWVWLRRIATNEGGVVGRSA